MPIDGKLLRTGRMKSLDAHKTCTVCVEGKELPLELAVGGEKQFSKDKASCLYRVEQFGLKQWGINSARAALNFPTLALNISLFFCTLDSLIPLQKMIRLP